MTQGVLIISIISFIDKKKESVYGRPLTYFYYISQRKINIVPKIVTKAMNIIKYTLP